MSALKFKAARVHFLSEVFVAVAVSLMLYLPLFLLRTKLCMLFTAMLTILVPNNNKAPAYIFFTALKAFPQMYVSDPHPLTV